MLCEVPTLTGTPCRRRVRDGPCHQHGGGRRGRPGGRVEVSERLADFLGSDRKWRHAVSRRLTGALDERLLDTLRTEVRRRSGCHTLAEVAAGLEDPRDELRHAIVYAALDERELPRIVAQRVFDSIPRPARDEPGQVGQAARALRLLGVFACAGLGLPLVRCRCLGALSATLQRLSFDRVVAIELDHAGF